MSKSMLKCLPVLMAFFFLFSVPAIVVALDENHVPEKIEWSATDTGEEAVKNAKARH